MNRFRSGRGAAAVRAAAEHLETRRLLSVFTVSNASDSGTGSLRDAINQANANPGADTIAFDSEAFSPPGLHTITLTGGTLEMADAAGPTLIIGPGAGTLQIRDNHGSTVFQVDAGVAATIQGLTISNGTDVGNIGGGAVLVTGGTLTLTDCDLRNNNAGYYGGQGFGNFGGGALFGAPRSTLNVTRCTFEQNLAYSGAAIFTQNNTTVLITDSAFSENTASGDGGAVYSAGTVTVANSTFVRNTADVGGAIYNAGGRFTLANCTIADNTGRITGGILNGGTFTLNNSIVAQNLNASGQPSDITQSTGPLVSGMFNVIGTGGSGGLAGGTANQLNVANPLLAPPGDQGGPSPTVALLPGSPAIDQGSNSLAVGPDGKPLTTDQRGLPRVFNSNVDIGAFEVQPVPGDGNGDGKVDFADLLVLAQHYGRSDVPPSQDGDLNGDRAVGFADLLILAQHYSSGAAASAEPAPVLVGQACAGGMAHLLISGVSADSGGVEIQQSSNGITWADAVGSPAPRAASSFDVSGLDPTRTYLFRARSLSGGATSNASPFSAVVSVSAAGPQPIQDGNGFAGASGLQLNGTATLVAPQGGDAGAIQLTPMKVLAAGSVFATGVQNVASFDTTFDFAIPQQKGADGLTFVIENAPDGPGALGPPGGGLGYGPDSPTGLGPGIPDSVAVKFDLFSNRGEGPDSTGLFVDGDSPTIPAGGNPAEATVDMSPSGVDLHSTTDTFRVHLAYDGTVLHETVTDLSTAKSFQHDYMVDIPLLVGGRCAYVGFTAGTGLGMGIYNLLDWTYTGG